MPGSGRGYYEEHLDREGRAAKKIVLVAIILVGPIFVLGVRACVDLARREKACEAACERLGKYSVLGSRGCVCNGNLPLRCSAAGFGDTCVPDDLREHELEEIDEAR